MYKKLNGVKEQRKVVAPSDRATLQLAHTFAMAHKLRANGHGRGTPIQRAS
jgi:hypothetical protein